MSKYVWLDKTDPTMLTTTYVDKTFVFFFWENKPRLNYMKCDVVCCDCVDAAAVAKRRWFLLMSERKEVHLKIIAASTSECVLCSYAKVNCRLIWFWYKKKWKKIERTNLFFCIFPSHFCSFAISSCEVIFIVVSRLNVRSNQSVVIRFGWKISISGHKVNVVLTMIFSVSRARSHNQTMRN